MEIPVFRKTAAIWKCWFQMYYSIYYNIVTQNELLLHKFAFLSNVCSNAEVVHYCRFYSVNAKDLCVWEQLYPDSTKATLQRIQTSITNSSYTKGCSDCRRRKKPLRKTEYNRLSMWGTWDLKSESLKHRSNL